MPALEVKDCNELLREALGGAQCLSLDVLGSTAAGENYGSTFLRLSARLRDESRPEGQQEYSLPLVAKMLPPTQYLRELFNVNVSFKKEAQFYTCVVPAWEALQLELGVPEDKRINIFPKLYGVRKGGPDDVVDDEAIIVLENIVEAGFKSGQRHKGLDLDHCRLTVRELGKFHALGIALKKKKPAVFFGPVQQAGVHFQANKTPEERLQELVDWNSSVVKLMEEYVPELQPHMARLKEALLRSKRNQPDIDPRRPFSTFLHVDFWVNNMMFAYKDGKPSAYKMFDFQLTTIGSPVYDLVFFLYSSGDSLVVKKHLDELFKEYHDSFFSYLELHDAASPDLDWEAFQAELEEFAPREMTHLYPMINIIRATNSVELVDTNDEQVFSRDLGCSAPAAERFCEMTDDLTRRGWV